MLNAGALVIFAILAILAYWPVSPVSTRELVGAAVGDPVQMVWFVGWMAHALAHVDNPWFSHAIDVPTGANLATNTSVLPLGLLLAPVTWTLGPVAAVNLGFRLALFLSASSLFVVLRSWRTWWPAALAGGLVYGFGPFMEFQGWQHLNLVFLPLPPLILWLVVELFIRRRRRPARVGAALGVATGLQFLIDPEVLLELAILVGAGLIVAVLSHPRKARAALEGCWTGLVSAGGVLVCLTGYPLWMLIAGPQHVFGLIQPYWVDSGYHAELAAALQRHWTGTLTMPDGHLYAPGGSVFRWQDSTAFLGLPLAGIVVLAVVLTKRPATRATAVLTLTSYVFSLGPTLELGAGLGSLPLPAALFRVLPFTGDLLPIRFSSCTALFAAVTLALAVDELYRAGLPARRARRSAMLRRSAAQPVPDATSPVSSPARPGRGWSQLRRERRRGWGWAATCVVLLAVALFPLAEGFPMPSAAVRWPTGLEGFLARAVPPGGTALVLPYVVSGNDEPMGWQALSGFRYRLIGGYAIVPAPPTGAGSYQAPPPYVAVVLTTGIVHPAGFGVVEAGFRPGGQYCLELRRLVRRRGVAVVALWQLTPASRAVAAVTARCLGRPSFTSSSTAAWLVASGHQALAQDAEN